MTQRIQLRWARSILAAVPILFALIALLGCATGGAPQSALPWDPNLITKNRQAEATRWAKDLERRTFIKPYMDFLCTPDGPWAKMDAGWKLESAEEWTKLWTFQPVPNTPPGGQQIDWSKIIEALVGIGIKVATGGIGVAKTVLPASLPPC